MGRKPRIARPAWASRPTKRQGAEGVRGWRARGILRVSRARPTSTAPLCAAEAGKTRQRTETTLRHAKRAGQTCQILPCWERFLLGGFSPLHSEGMEQEALRCAPTGRAL